MHVNITTWIRTEVSLPKTFITIGIVAISSSGTVQTKHGTQAQCFPASAHVVAHTLLRVLTIALCGWQVRNQGAILKMRLGKVTNSRAHTVVARTQAPWSKSQILNSFPFQCSHPPYRGFNELSLGPSGFVGVQAHASPSRESHLTSPGLSLLINATCSLSPQSCHEDNE